MSAMTIEDAPRAQAAGYLATLTEDELQQFLTEARATTPSGIPAGRALFDELHGESPVTGRVTSLSAGRNLYRKGHRQ